MYPRPKYKQVSISDLPTHDRMVATYKYDGGNYHVPVAADGGLRFISRRESVRGGYPDKTDRLPHFLDIKIPQYAGNVYTVELIHTGHSKHNPESHSAVSGILNSLPERAADTQRQTGPVRAVIHEVVYPQLNTYAEKLAHMKEVENAINRPEVFFSVKPYYGADIFKLIRSTKVNKNEGVIATNLDTPESQNIRYKLKHKVHYNLRVVRIIQEIDINGVPKNSMGAVDVADSTGTVVGTVGTGFTRADRLDAFNHPANWMGKLIQVESMGIAASKLRSPVYNGDADGEIDTVPLNSPQE